VEKVRIHIYRVTDTVVIDEAVPVGDNNGMAPVGGGRNDQATQTLLLVRVIRLKLQQAECHRQQETQVNNLHQFCTMSFNIIFNNFRRYGETMPGALAVQRQRGGRNRNNQQHQANQQQAAGVVDGPGAAVLCHNPRTLMELWLEYKQGIHGHKAAEQFTTREKNNRVGGTKQKYYRRNAVWQCMDRLVRAGNTPQAAARKI
jgi:hypothetical protein